ncbi:hypothetical protein MPTK1_1g15600 [Marchantia polymorpha subsp. ruderalis]|uniref:Uncharacterized protein n=2 Tax=Marchantia polymorpha TaxID=3197 RepID=A0AAF6AQI6_MARPO|nr:hypothetical protein MARPO_0033s0101 [Marchantia polymorpha]BBM98706.1 hypothetical protein Mp_1g15600 [Marchantia polymorpha subsp. ruderalis]|eukprot:PTQ41700.1 hypothetical protein MARPO_0033s0101 [Marchantia polymorpha]
MERLVRKYEQRFRRVKEEMSTWDALHGRLVKQYSNAAAILDRLPVLVAVENYGVLGNELSMARDLPAAQVESLELLFRAMTNTLSDLSRVVAALEKVWRDGCQLLKAERQQPTASQMQQRVGPRPSLQDCVNGLHTLYQMHFDEYNLKVAIVSSLTYGSRGEDVSALQSLLVDQPNIPSTEVRYIFDLIDGGEGK